MGQDWSTGSGLERWVRTGALRRRFSALVWTECSIPAPPPQAETAEIPTRWRADRGQGSCLLSWSARIRALGQE